MENTVNAPEGIGISDETWSLVPLEVKRAISAMIDEYTKIIDASVKQVALLSARVTELESKLNINSLNSSKPPSSDPPSMPQRKPKVSSRRRGGQPGHPGAHRMMVPKPDFILNEAPTNCHECGTGLGDEPLFGTPERRQVIELPEIQPIVTEHRLYQRRCPHCNHLTRAAGPLSAFGPNAHAHIAVLAGRFHLSHRDIQTYFTQHLHVNIGLGSIAAVERRASVALAPAAQEAWESVKNSPVRHLDETSWRLKNTRAWIWVARSEDATAFAIEPSRGQEVLRARFGNALDNGYIVTDRYRAYNLVEMKRRGICHAHLKRDFTKLSELPHEEGRLIGELCLYQQHEVFQLAGRFSASEISQEHFFAEYENECEIMRKLLQRGTLVKGATAAAKTIRGMCGDLLAHWQAMWTWLSVPGVSATNNAAERALRPAVLKRKISYGSQSIVGSRFIERMLTVGQTCIQRGLDVEAFLIGTMRSAMFGEPVPSLLAH